MNLLRGLDGFWEVLVAMTGISLAFLVAVRVSIVTMLRASNSDLRERVKEMDVELAGFRESKKELLAWVEELTHRVAVSENRTTMQAAMLYDRQRYIGRLERGYREMGKPLPPKDRIGGALADQVEQ